MQVILQRTFPGIRPLSYQSFLFDDSIDVIVRFERTIIRSPVDHFEKVNFETAVKSWLNRPTLFSNICMHVVDF